MYNIVIRVSFGHNVKTVFSCSTQFNTHIVIIVITLHVLHDHTSYDAGADVDFFLCNTFIIILCGNILSYHTYTYTEIIRKRNNGTITMYNIIIQYSGMYRIIHNGALEWSNEKRTSIITIYSFVNIITVIKYLI